MLTFGPWIATAHVVQLFWSWLYNLGKERASQKLSWLHDLVQIASHDWAPAEFSCQTSVCIFSSKLYLTNIQQPLVCALFCLIHHHQLRCFPVLFFFFTYATSSFQIQATAIIWCMRYRHVVFNIVSSTLLQVVGFIFFRLTLVRKTLFWLLPLKDAMTS